MRFSIIAATASLSPIAFATHLDARQISALPTCAQSCVTNNFQGCNNLDIACICGKTSLITDLSCCVSKSCNADDQAFTIQFAQKLCSTYHITLPTAAGCSATTGATSATSSTNATVASTAAATVTGTSTGSKTSSAVAATNTNAASNALAAFIAPVGAALAIAAGLASLCCL